MRSICIILLLFFNRPVFSQSIAETHIFNDTSLYFISQIDSLNPVNLSAAELTQIERYLVTAIDEFNRSLQRYADSVNPENDKRKFQAWRIDINNYVFKLVPKLNKQNQKEIWISGNCKGMSKTGGKTSPDPAWKRKFIDPLRIDDGGSCFIYLFVNLTLKEYGQLGMNSMA